MLSLKSQPQGFELRAGSVSLNLEEAKLQLDELSFTRPGEYEARGVEIIYGETSALIIWERLQLVYIFGGSPPTAFERSQFAPSDVILIGRTALSQLNKAHFSELLEIYDPKLAVLHPAVSTTALKDAVKFTNSESLKISAASLPSEGREFVVLG